jgi:hypothetical protein
MVTAPLSLGSRTTGQKTLIEYSHTDNLVARKRTLESDLPSTAAIEISSEIDEKSWIDFEESFYLIDEVSLPDSPTLDLDPIREKNMIILYLHTSIISSSQILTQSIT